MGYRKVFRSVLGVENPDIPSPMDRKNGFLLSGVSRGVHAKVVEKGEPEVG